MKLRKTKKKNLLIDNVKNGKKRYYNVIKFLKTILLCMKIEITNVSRTCLWDGVKKIENSTMRNVFFNQIACVSETQEFL